MLSNLWCRIVRQKRAQSRVSPGTRLYAVGDIHDRADLLRGIRRLIHEDACRAQGPATSWSISATISTAARTRAR